MVLLGDRVVGQCILLLLVAQVVPPRVVVLFRRVHSFILGNSILPNGEMMGQLLLLLQRLQQQQLHGHKKEPWRQYPVEAVTGSST